MSLKKLPVFYGWYIVIALFLIWTIIAGIVVSGFTSFFEPIINRYGWNHTQVSFAASLRDLMLVILLPIAGLLVDRFSARKLVFAGIVFISLGLFFLGRINSLSHFYLCFILIGIGLSTSTVTIPLTVIGRWFRKKVSLVTGIVTSGASVAGLLVPLVTWVIDAFKWQMAMAILGLSLFGILAPLSLLIRQKPEQYGYLPDGDVNENLIFSEGQTTARGIGVDIGIKQSLKSSVFWRISLALALHAIVGAAVVTHIMPYLSTVGINRMTSSYMASALSIVGVIGRIGVGWFGDKFDKRWVAASGTILVGLGLLLLSYVSTTATWGIWSAVVIIGIGWGGTITMHSVLILEYFGIRNLGTIVGFSAGIASIGIMAGPPLLSWIFESFDSYQIAWFVFIGIVAVSVISQVTNPSISKFIRKASSYTAGT